MMIYLDTEQADDRVPDLHEEVAQILDDRGAHVAAAFVRDPDREQEIHDTYLGPMIDQIEDDHPDVEPPAVPNGFWPQVSHQLERIATTPATTFAEVQGILLDPTYADVVAEINANGVRTFHADTAFFAGSGGENSLQEALRKAGWGTTWQEASYHYSMVHRSSGDGLHYVEGDLYRV